MFYFFSKLLFFLLQPSFWVFLFLFIAFFNRKRRKKFLGIALFIYLVLGNSFLFNSALSGIEAKSNKITNETFECGLLLGGYGQYAEQSNGLELNQAADRLSQTLSLYQSGKIERIVILSGAYSKGFPLKKESEITRDFLLKCNVDPADIFIENLSLNTHQNALNAKIIMQKNNLKGPALLITSAFHMKRAKACFDTQGIKTVAFPTDFQSEHLPFSLENHVFPSTTTLCKWPMVFKEIIGYWVYDIKGYID